MSRRRASLDGPLESAIQQSFIQWARLAEKTTAPELALLFSVPNGGHRSAKTAATMKMEGQRPGVADLLFALPVDPFNGLAIEFKRPGEKQSTAQKEFERNIVKLGGWRYVVCFSVEDAIQVVVQHLKRFRTLQDLPVPKSWKNPTAFDTVLDMAISYPQAIPSLPGSQ